MNRLCLTIAALHLITLIEAQPTDTEFKAYEQKVEGTTLQFKMMPIPAGTFVMGGAPEDKDAAQNEKPRRTVSISPFYIGAYEVTHDAFEIFFNDEVISQNSKLDAVTRPSPPYIDFSLGMGKEGGFPANSLSQYSALMFCRWLYEKTGVFYRLPTEAEWEYACRAGATTVYPFGNNIAELGKYAWYKANSNNRYHKVGTLQPNAWGLYDMLGNVAEWTLDQYTDDYFNTIKDASKDPLITPISKQSRTSRGGSYENDAAAVRCSARTPWQAAWNRRDPQIPKSRWWLTDAPFAGFRIVRPVQQPTKEEAEAFFKTHLGQ